MLTFLKLGGSLITDKAGTEAAREDVIARLGGEIRAAHEANGGLGLLVGHGSGSFGHNAAERHGTRQGVATPEQWRGFAEVAVVAARLNNLVTEAFHAAGLPVFRVQPSASALCRDGVITSMALEPIRAALAHGLIPLVHGDVAVDEVRGGTIISTEDVFTYLAKQLRPARILLAGDYEGVRDEHGELVRRITPSTLPALRAALGGSEQTDVTGGMAAKVESMLALCVAVPGLSIRIFDGRPPGAVHDVLTRPEFGAGTLLEAD